MYERNLCPKSETYRFTHPGEPCWHCKSRTEQRAILDAKQQANVEIFNITEATPAASNVENSDIPPAPAVSPVQNLDTPPVTFGGHTITAPGFTPEQFERAIARALSDELVVHEAAGYHLVTHRSVNGGYHTMRTSCDSKAGEYGQPCKHRAILCFHLDVREPAIRRQWTDAQKAVAA
ncbi:MAG TPA: hypothetical protein VGR22_04390 [Thermomicrobiales bacterium]|nr:hypothetical protein [Thermomicrobiales bacterium]